MTREAKKSLNCVCPAGRERSYGGIFVLGGEREGKTKRQMSEVHFFLNYANMRAFLFDFKEKMDERRTGRTAGQVPPIRVRYG